MGDSSSQKNPTQVLLTGCSSSQTAPAWALPTGCSPSGTGCSSVGPHRVTSPASKPAPAWAPLSTGPQVLAGACSSIGFPQGHNLLHTHLPSPPWISMGCTGTACLTMVFSTVCKGISALAPGAPPCPLSSLTFILHVHMAVSVTYSYSSLLVAIVVMQGFFSPS